MEGFYFVFLAGVVCAGSPSLVDEKYTKFEYEYKVLERIVELEHDHKEIKNLADKIHQLEDVNHETAKILESQAETIKQQENDITDLRRNHVSDIKDVNSALGEIEKYTETYVNRQSHVIEELKKTYGSDIDELRKLAESAGTSKSTYTRWGRSDCPTNGTELVYDGYIGGSYFHHHGGASNYVCLTKQPIWGHIQTGKQGNGFMYGGIYEFAHHNGHGKDFFGRDLYRFPATCAICRTNRPTVIMIPGRNKCLDGWTLEYHGYLAASHYGHHLSTKYTCVDHSPTSMSQTGLGHDTGSLLYLVEAICGALKCPPYIDNAELTCVVCSK